ncbi:UbiA prenyltransferase [Mycena galopus ATCC 62051]|nr:UbiA prenyltransferase [Mycena galopus ATCC 62051]
MSDIELYIPVLTPAWSIAMVYRAQSEISASTALLRAIAYVPLCFGIKSLIMTIDDLLDHDIDAQVERTKNRALPRGAISLVRAWMFFGLQVISGLYLAMTTLSAPALYASMPAWPLYILYPTCKRWTNLAPIPLGLMFKVGIFMGWSDLSLNGSIVWHVLVPVYLGACLWTITYETIYQHQAGPVSLDDFDKIDDMRIGINSPALLCREYTISVCSVTALGFLGLLAYGGSMNDQGVPFYVSVAIVGAMLLTALLRTDIDNPDDCKAFFLLTPLFGQIILGGLVTDAVFHRIVEGIAL